MRIGFDASQTGPGKAGCGFYADGLLRALMDCDKENNYVVYPTFGDHFYDSQISCDYVASCGNAQLRPVQQHSEAKKFWARPDQTFESQLGNPDIVQANNFFAPSGLIHARLVYTVYDLGFLENWSWTTEDNRTGCFEGVFRASISADWLVAISHYSKERFMEFFPHYPPERITVVYPASRFASEAADEEPASVRLERRKFWLCVGTVEPRKNYAGILSAYAKLRERVRGEAYPLVIAGGAGWMLDMQAAIQKLDLGDSVVLLGYTEDAVLAWLYRNTRCLVYPSLYEGFGMPVLEAMSCGSPVIAANGSAFSEIIGAGELSRLAVDPRDPDSIFSAMQVVHHMAAGELDRLGSIARNRAGQFSWSRSARSLLNVYRQAADLPKLFS